MKTIYLKLIVLLFSVSVSAQQKISKIDKSIGVDKDVTIDLNTSHTNIEVETWNKDYVEIEAFIESNTLSKEELQKAIDNWNVSVNGDGDYVKITSTGGGIWSNDISVNIFDEESLEALANIPMDLNLNLEPLFDGLKNLESLKVLKDLPEHLSSLGIPKSPDGNYNVDFDFEKYKEEGEPYLDRWSKKYRTEYGEEYEEEMRTWAKNIKQEDLDKFEKEMEEWGEKFGKEIEETFGKDFEEKMEKWGEEFGKNFEKNFGKDFEKKMEKWGEEFGKNLEDALEQAFEGLDDDNTKKSKSSRKQKNKNLFDGDNYNLNKTIKIKMPKKAKLKLNVKHGELKMVSVLHNVKADIAHGSLLAQSIDGSSSSINVAYSTVFIKEWKEGELNLKYVDNAMIQNVDQLMLNAVSSTIGLDYVKGNTIINGSFGELIIHNISPTFNNLNIVLENSDAMLKLPKNVDYKLFFKGDRSQFNNETTSNKKIDHFINKTNSNNTIIINAKYSNVIAE